MKTVVERVDALKPEVAALIREIHDNPEVGYQEYKAVELQAALLEKYDPFTRSLEEVDSWQNEL